MSHPTPVIAIYDIGKTNKKVFLFNESYEIVYEKSSPFPEITDEDGDSCDDVTKLSGWVTQSFEELNKLGEFNIIAVNFTAYGASFVNTGADGKPVTPLYNYLKPYPEELKKKFYDTYGGEIAVSMYTASPVLGNLNSGMLLYWLKNRRPEAFEKVKYSLHLPQYISSLLIKKAYSDITSIGCHTILWNFPQNNYHEWVYREGIVDKLAPIFPSDGIVDIEIHGKKLKAGIGLHDSSSALIPYLINFREPFVLISTGTWAISLNPFNNAPLTVAELQQDCLCYMSYHGASVKASRFFAGYEHEQQTKRLAEHFGKPLNYYTTVQYDPSVTDALTASAATSVTVALGGITAFSGRSLNSFSSYEQAYHQLMLDIMQGQIASTQLILEGSDVKRIFVDGGFSKNPLYMNLLAKAFPGIEVYAAYVAQATALGAALAIHQHWNKKPVPSNIIELMYYRVTE
ncbi:MAG: carbohydrate kinase [Chitinophagaceae bacterium]|nr:carbohydrate kinase [Chitinophagaceae bacterium]